MTSGPRSLKDLPVTSQQAADTRLLNSPCNRGSSIPNNRERTFEREREHAFEYDRREENSKDAGETYLRTYAPSEICDRIGCQSCSELLSQPLVKTRLDKRFVTVPTRLKVAQNAKVQGEIRTDEIAAFKNESKFAAKKTMSNCDVRNNIGVTSSTDLQKHTGGNLDRNNYSEQLTQNKDKKSNICNVCGFRFIRPVDLEKHLNTHKSLVLTLGLDVKGLIPRNANFRQRYTVSTTEAISEYERSKMKDREALNLQRREVSLQNGEYCPKGLEDRTLISTQFRLPLGEVRPEMTEVLRPTTEPAIVPSPHSVSPYFMKHGDPKKSFMSVHSLKQQSGDSKTSRRLKSVIVVPIKHKQEQKVGEYQLKRKYKLNERDEGERETKRLYKKISSVNCCRKSSNSTSSVHNKSKNQGKTAGDLPSYGRLRSVIVVPEKKLQPTICVNLNGQQKIKVEKRKCPIESEIEEIVSEKKRKNSERSRHHNEEMRHRYNQEDKCSESVRFQCGYCQKSFSQKMLLQRHYVVHTGERPYSCKICKKTFTQYDSVRRHEIKQHK